MEATPALEARPLMDKDTFLDTFHQKNLKHETYLCYEVELQEDDAWIPVDEYKGFLRNQGVDTTETRRHAELCLLDRIGSWELNTEQHYRVTCFISWSPCYDCARELAAFLGANSHLSLRVFASRIYTLDKDETGRRIDTVKYKTGLRQLQAAGAQIDIMAYKEFEYCWETFVDHQGAAFPSWDGLNNNSEEISKALKDILQNQEN